MSDFTGLFPPAPATMDHLGGVSRSLHERFDRMEGLLGGIKDTLGRLTSTAEVIARLLERDNHYWGDRPCSTCMGISGLLGRPFGCEKRRQEKAKGGGDAR